MKYVVSVWILLSIVALQLDVRAFARNKQSGSNVKVLLCKGTQVAGEKTIDFTWTYTIDFSARTVDGFRADISDQRITWQLKSKTVVDDREISRYSQKFHFAGKARSNGSEIYYGDGTCEPQEQRAF